MKKLLILNYWEVVSNFWEFIPNFRELICLLESLYFIFVNPFIRTKVRTPIKWINFKSFLHLTFFFQSKSCTNIKLSTSGGSPYKGGIEILPKGVLVTDDGALLPEVKNVFTTSKYFD